MDILGIEFGGGEYLPPSESFRFGFVGFPIGDDEFGRKHGTIIPMVINFLDDLNPEQRRAVTHPGGPVLILAGAGSGKTRCLTYRVAWLISDQLVDPSRILLLTFTNKAAGEMKERVKKLFVEAIKTIRGPLPKKHSACEYCSWGYNLAEFD